MASPTRTPVAGGLLIALGAMIGSVVGLFQLQPTLGFLIGSGVGIALAILIWLIDRRR